MPVKTRAERLAMKGLKKGSCLSRYCTQTNARYVAFLLIEVGVMCLLTFAHGPAELGNSFRVDNRTMEHIGLWEKCVERNRSIVNCTYQIMSADLTQTENIILMATRATGALALVSCLILMGFVLNCIFVESWNKSVWGPVSCLVVSIPQALFTMTSLGCIIAYTVVHVRNIPDPGPTFVALLIATFITLFLPLYPIKMYQRVSQETEKRRAARKEQNTDPTDEIMIENQSMPLLQSQQNAANMRPNGSAMPENGPSTAGSNRDDEGELLDATSPNYEDGTPSPYRKVVKRNPREDSWYSEDDVFKYIQQVSSNKQRPRQQAPAPRPQPIPQIKEDDEYEECFEAFSQNF